MDRWILSGICLAALSVAASLALRWGGLRRPEPPAQDARFGANVLATLRAATVTLYAASISGILVAGFGSRLFMRILAATSPDSLRGVQTQAQEEIGRVTFGGSAFLIVFNGLLAGLITATAYRATRRWLPATAWRAGIVITLVLFGVFGASQDLLAADNKDFRVLSPVWLAIVLIGATALLFGATLAAVHDRLERCLPPLSRQPRALVAYAPLLAYVMTIVALPALVVVSLVGGVLAPAVRRLSAAPPLVRWGRRAVPVAAAISALVVVSNAFDVLTLS